MKKIISILSLVCLVLSVQAVNAASLIPEPHITTDLPSYCFGVNIDNAIDEIEVIRLSDYVYSADNGIIYHLGNVVPRVGGVTMNGAVSGVAFAGGGSESWEMNLNVRSEGTSGVLTLQANTWTGNFTTIYDLICE